MTAQGKGSRKTIGQMIDDLLGCYSAGEHDVSINNSLDLVSNRKIWVVIHGGHITEGRTLKSALRKALAGKRKKKP